MRKLFLSAIHLVGGGSLSQAQDVVNQWFVYGPDGGHTLKIATLPASSAGTYDHLHLLTTINFNDVASNNLSLDLVFGNRNGFTYSYTARGGPFYSLVKIAAYQNADTSVDIYMILGNNYVEGSYTIVEAEDEDVYSSPADTGAATPPGTLVFDSSNPTYPPTTYTGFNGSIGIGTTSPGADLAALPSPPSSTTPILEVNGVIALMQGKGGSVIFPDGTSQSTAWNGTTLGGDYAEAVDVLGDKKGYESGDVIVIDPTAPGRFVKSDKAYSKLVAGVYSTKPRLVGRRTTAERPNREAEVPMAMMGIVPTKVCTENGSVAPGDLLVSPKTAGYAMKGTDRKRLTGAVIGKALASMKSGSGVIEVLVSLQ